MDGYFDQGAHHLNVNVFGKDKLLDAMENPDKPVYANFTIRVSEINLTAYPDTRIVKLAYSGLSGFSIASRSLSLPNTVQRHQDFLLH